MHPRYFFGQCLQDRGATFAAFLLYEEKRPMKALFYLNKELIERKITMNIDHLGWNSFFEKQFEELKDQNLIPARIAQEQKNIYQIYSELGELRAEVSGRFIHTARSKGDFPAVGDWVAILPRPEGDKAMIHHLLPRGTSFSRKAVLSGGMPDTGGRTEEQILAANVDVAFLVSGLDGELNLRRIERYLAVAWDSGASPVVVLNKSDVCTKVEEHVKEVESIAFGVPILTISATQNIGLDAFSLHISSGKTAVFLGSSGVGKSSIINSLLGEEHLEIAPVRQYDKKGRHTTTSREMIILPTGGIVIDTPGMRELGMWSDQDGISRTFDDIEELALECRFRDCKHQGEPGCAVQQAIEDGILDARRFQSYLKLKKELALLAIRKDQRAKLDAKKRWKDIAKLRRQFKKR
jgi:ribosome biogenesis GTPase